MGQSSTKMDKVKLMEKKQGSRIIGEGIYSQADISKMLNIPKSTISRDIEYLKEES